MSITPLDRQTPEWPIEAMTASERRGLRAIEHAQAPTREAFLTDIADAKRRRDARQRQAQRARNPFRLTDKGVTLLLVWPSAIIGAAVLSFAVWALLFTNWL